MKTFCIIQPVNSRTTFSCYFENKMTTKPNGMPISLSEAKSDAVLIAFPTLLIL